MTPDPFAVLGLPARPDLTDDDVRSAWRRIAATTHPDLPGGGDPARYAAGSAAYAELRTSSGRGEAYADLAAGTGRRRGLGSPRSGVAPGPGRMPRTDASIDPRTMRRTDTSLDPGMRPGAAPDLDSGPPAAGRGASGFASRIRRGRPAVLALRILIAAGVCAAAFAVAGWQPAPAGLATGALTWLVLTARADIRPPGG